MVKKLIKLALAEQQEFYRLEGAIEMMLFEMDKFSITITEPCDRYFKFLN